MIGAEKIALGELFDIGSSKRVFQSEWRNKGVPFYRAREIARLSEDGFVDNELFIDEELYDRYIAEYGKPMPGDIMVTGVGTLGVCYIVQEDDKFYFKDGNILWFRARNTDTVLSQFVVRAFDSDYVKDEIRKNSSGTTVGTFTIQTAKKLEIWVPPMEDQRKIVDRLTVIDKLIALRKEQIAKLDELVKARFVEMFGTIHDNKLCYEIKTLQDVCEQIKDGTHQTPTYTDDSVNGYKFLSSKDVTTGKIDWSHLKYIPKELHNELYARIAPQKGDVLLAKNGTTGIAAIVDRDEIFDIYVSLALLRPIDVESVYLWAAINSAETKHQFDASLKGIGVPNLHLGEIKKAKILIPPIDEQKKFAAFVEQTNKTKLTIQSSLDKLEVMKKALMQEYFG